MPKDLKKLFGGKAASNVGLDDESTEIVISNLNATHLPKITGGPLENDPSDDRINLLFIFDASGSMKPVAQTLIDEFNNTLMPALRGASQENVQAIRIGGLVFNDSVQPLWPGNKLLLLDDVPIMNSSHYRIAGSTCLHQAQLDGLSLIAVFADEVIQQTGTAAKNIVVVLSDGANNLPPYGTDAVMKVASKLSREQFVLAFAGFQTDEPVDFHQIAKDTGFGAVYVLEAKPGESDQEKQRRFRHLIGVLSSSLSTQSSKDLDDSSAGSFWKN